MKNAKERKLLFIVNVDWYFKLHWLDRMYAAKKAGYEVYLVTNFSDEGLFQDLKTAGIGVFNFNLSRAGLNPFVEFWAIIGLFKLVNRIEPDLIHSITMKPNIYAGMIARIKKLPIVCSVTGLGVIFSRKSVKNHFVKVLISFFYRLISKNIKSIFLFENNSDRELFINKGIVSSVNSKRISGAGVNVEAYNYTREDNDSIPSILFAARLLQDKGLRSLIEAVRLLRERGLSVELNVAGIFDKSAQNAISEKQIKKWSDDGDIVWLGTRNDVAELISLSSIVCLPTTYGEGVPRILIESCACGRAVVTTNVSGCNEFVVDGYNGLLVEPNNVVDLAKALRLLIEDAALREKLGKNGRILVVNEYSTGIVIDQTLTTYTDLLV
ncbi:MAG: glycosyltransferase family 4 protein [Gammaproteobacteria bacterium]|nr:glycosyltransferase family 4 protein [Gammaproteobacteria bacterium]